MAKYAQRTTLTTSPGQRDELAGPALEMAKLARSAPGCETFAVCISPSQPTVAWLFELLETRQSHDALTASEPTSEIARRTMTLLAGPPEQIELTVIDKTAIDAAQVSPPLSRANQEYWLASCPS